MHANDNFDKLWAESMKRASAPDYSREVEEMAARFREEYLIQKLIETGKA